MSYHKCVLYAPWTAILNRCAAPTSKPTKSWPEVRFKPKAFVCA